MGPQPCACDADTGNMDYSLCQTFPSLLSTWSPAAPTVPAVCRHFPMVLKEQVSAAVWQENEVGGLLTCGGFSFEWLNSIQASLDK